MVLSAFDGPEAKKPLYCRQFSRPKTPNHSTVEAFRPGGPQTTVLSALFGPEAQKL